MCVLVNICGQTNAAIKYCKLMHLPEYIHRCIPRTLVFHIMEYRGIGDGQVNTTIPRFPLIVSLSYRRCFNNCVVCQILVMRSRIELSWLLYSNSDSFPHLSPAHLLADKGGLSKWPDWRRCSHKPQSRLTQFRLRTLCLSLPLPLWLLFMYLCQCRL